MNTKILMMCVFVVLVCGISTAGAVTTPVQEDAVPILLYHGVHPENTTEYITSPEQFTANLQYLKDNNYNVITFRQLINYLETGTKIPSKPVVLTFDDGRQDNYDYAFPILESFGYKATFGIVTSYPVNATMNATLMMNWTSIKEIHDAGHDIQSHTVTHPDLTSLGAPDLAYELEQSRTDIYNNVSEYPNGLLIPYGAHNADVWTAAENAGYKAARMSGKASGGTSHDYRAVILRNWYLDDRTAIYNKFSFPSAYYVNNETTQADFIAMVAQSGHYEFEDTREILVNGGNIGDEINYIPENSFGTLVLQDAGDKINNRFQVATDGYYDIKAVVKCGDNFATVPYNRANRYTYTIDGGTEYIGNSTAPTTIAYYNLTGDWPSTWGSQYISNDSIYLTAGVHTLTVEAGTGGWVNVDYFTVDYIVPPAPADSSTAKESVNGLVYAGFTLLALLCIVVVGRQLMSGDYEAGTLSFIMQIAVGLTVCIIIFGSIMAVI